MTELDLSKYFLSVNGWLCFLTSIIRSCMISDKKTINFFVPEKIAELYDISHNTEDLFRIKMRSITNPYALGSNVSDGSFEIRKSVIEELKKL